LSTRSAGERAQWRQAIHAYERSTTWADRSTAYKRKHGYRCAACGSTYGQIDTHHLDYQRALRDPGQEPDSDLIALCHLHHMAVHDFVRAHPQQGLRDGSWVVINHIRKQRANDRALGVTGGKQHGALYRLFRWLWAIIAVLAVGGVVAYAFLDMWG